MRRMGPLHIAVAAVCLGVLPGMAEPGFGTLHKKKIELVIRQPGKVRLANTSFALTGSSTNREYCLVQDSLLATLETELISNEKTLVRQPVPTSADWIINVRITGFSNPQPLVQQVGTGGSSGSFLRCSGSLGLAYQTVAVARTTPATSAASMTSNLNATAAPCRSISLPRLVEE